MGKYPTFLNHKFRDHNKYVFADKERLGKGGFSEVFLGHDRDDPSRQVAIKVLKEVDSDRIRKEVSILKRLEGHPEII